MNTDTKEFETKIVWDGKGMEQLDIMKGKRSVGRGHFLIPRREVQNGAYDHFAYWNFKISHESLKMQDWVLSVVIEFI